MFNKGLREVIAGRGGLNKKKNLENAIRLKYIYIYIYIFFFQKMPRLIIKRSSFFEKKKRASTHSLTLSLAGRSMAFGRGLKKKETNCDNPSKLGK